MSQYLSAFLLGNAAILGNVCVLPLYPGLIAFLAGSAQAGRQRQGGVFLGAAVLAGVLLTMIILGLVLYRLGQIFSRILPWLLPLTYGVTALLSAAMVSAFALVAGSAVALGESLLYFLVFGIGFGWPLLVLPCWPYRCNAAAPAGSPATPRHLAGWRGSS